MDDLENWIIENNAIERVKLGFWKCIDNYKCDVYEEFEKYFQNIDMNLLKIQVYRVGSMISYRFDEPIKFILVQTEIEYNEEVMGIYESSFTIDGSDMDDYLRMNDINEIN